MANSPTKSSPTKSKGIRQYLVFPITYLILDLVQDYVSYKCELIEDPWIRTGAVISALVFGISILAFVLVPFIEGGLETVRKTHKSHGPLADFLVTCLILVALYFIYFLKINEGIRSILPPFMLN